MREETNPGANVEQRASNVPVTPDMAEVGTQSVPGTGRHQQSFFRDQVGASGLRNILTSMENMEFLGGQFDITPPSFFPLRNAREVNDEIQVADLPAGNADISSRVNDEMQVAELPAPNANFSLRNETNVDAIGLASNQELLPTLRAGNVENLRAENPVLANPPHPLEVSVMVRESRHTSPPSRPTSMQLQHNPSPSQSRAGRTDHDRQGRDHHIRSLAAGDPSGWPRVPTLQELGANFELPPPSSSTQPRQVIEPTNSWLRRTAQNSGSQRAPDHRASPAGDQGHRTSFVAPPRPPQHQDNMQHPHDGAVVPATHNDAYQRLEHQEMLREQARAEAKKALYTSQYNLFVSNIRGIQTTLHRMRDGCSWEEIHHLTNHIDSVKEKLTSLNAVWSDMLASLLNATEIEEARRMGQQHMTTLGRELTKASMELGQLIPRERTSQPAGTGQSSQVHRVNLERLSVPTFSGISLEFPEFMVNFKALTEGQGLKTEMKLLYLRQALPKEYRHLLTGASNMEVAWKRLQDRFGDPQQVTISIYDKLAKLELKGKDYEKIEKLHFEVELAESLLSQVGMLTAIKGDLYLVNMLLSKLPPTMLERWVEFAHDQQERVVAGLNDWKYFKLWLQRQNALAVRTRLAHMTQGRPGTQPLRPSAPKSQCTKCGSLGHRTSECTLPSSAHQLHSSSLGNLNAVQHEWMEMNASAVGFSSDQEREDRYKETEARFGTCRICGDRHTYKRRVGDELLDWPSCRVSSCPDWMNKSPSEKGRIMEEKGCCPKCLSWLHSKKDCPRKGYPCKRKVNGQSCKRYHDTLLHEAKNEYCEAATVVLANSSGFQHQTVLLAMQVIPAHVEGRRVRV